MSRKQPFSFKKLGFETYADYLGSDLWQGIRRRVLARDRRCACCRRFSNTVHHRNYFLATMDGSDISGLVGLCRGCHKKAEFRPDGTKKTLKQANRYIRRHSKKKGQRGARRPGKSRKKRRKAIMCPECKVNRRFHGGPCPFCLKKLGLPQPLLP